MRTFNYVAMAILVIGGPLAFSCPPSGRANAAPAAPNPSPGGARMLALRWCLIDVMGYRTQGRPGDYPADALMKWGFDTYGQYAWDGPEYERELRWDRMEQQMLDKCLPAATSKVKAGKLQTDAIKTFYARELAQLTSTTGQAPPPEEKPADAPAKPKGKPKAKAKSRAAKTPTKDTTETGRIVRYVDEAGQVWFLRVPQDKGARR
jgi:hypothetical protein